MTATLHAHPVFDPAILEGLHLLEADAGTGKTWTIAGLVVRALVERRLGIEQVLVVTFTNAATAELAARIRQRIAQLERLLDDRLEGRDPTVDEPFCVAYAARLGEDAARAARSVLRVALASADETSVHTIHGFCQRVIAEHALSIGVPAGLPVEADSGEHEAQVLADWWRAQLDDASPGRLQVFAMAGLTPATLSDALRAIAAQPLARVEPQQGDWRALEHELARVRADLAGALERERAGLLEWLGTKGNADGRRFRADLVAKWLAALAAFCADPSPQTMPEAASRLASERFAGRLPPSTIPAICDRLLALAGSLASARAWIARELAAEARARRAAALASAQVLDFDDLLRLVHDALADPASGAALARSLRERYPLALIDECQDTDALQWAIFRRIYVAGDDAVGDDAAGTPPDDAARASATLVLVGDPKQAIYAFRGADVYSYLEARESMRTVHRLGENQRSSPALIAAVNALFARERPFLVEEIGFAPAAVGARARRAFDGADGASRAPLTVVQLQPEGEAGAAGWLDAASAQRQAIAASVAEIARLLRAGARLGDRTLRPADIAVLVDSHRQGTAIKRALAAAGIGAAEMSRDSVLGTFECDETMRLIAAIDDPADTGLLRSALATTLLGGTAAALAALEADPARGLRLAGSLARARAEWESHGPLTALRRLVREEGVGARLAAVRDGDRRLTNLMHLVDLLAADAHARRGPRQALRMLARRRAAGADRDAESEELRLESDDDLVHILTVHKSKGLEFPVVFLPFAWSGRSASAAAPQRYHHRHATAAGWQAVLDFTPSEAALRQAALERHAESLRGLYVALTRAEQRCYVFWGAAAGAQHAPLAWLLEDLDPTLQSDWRANSRGAPPLDAESVRRTLAAWRARAQACEAGAIAIVASADLAAGRAGEDAGHGGRARTATPGDAPAVSGPAAAAPPDPAALAARPWRATIPAATITTSFSAMVSTQADDEAGASIAWQEIIERPDHDQQSMAEEPSMIEAPAPSAGTPASIRFRFPAGPHAGVCLHGILEESRFDAPLDRAAVAGRLARSGYRGIDAGEVSAWLEEAVAAPLQGPGGETLRLAEVAPACQVRELDFLLAGHGVSQVALIEAVGGEFALELEAGTARWRGFLRGFIDLVFEQHGRYYVLDWKSNHLGDEAHHYGPASLAASMQAHAYSLQACLYTLALHRWLRRCLPGYDYERHIGGALYVFLRGAGMASPAPAGVGVHALRPGARLIRTLDRLLGAPRGAASS
ncbi:MAG: UvrD-helicase domain-containing protein [Burkholderiales bacterium]|nr:UvrD-helicase domain-containing protein [Burkholderiales bacterium]